MARPLTTEEQERILDAIDDWSLVEAVSHYTSWQISLTIGVSHAQVNRRLASPGVAGVLEQIAETIKIRVLHRREADITAALDCAVGIVRNVESHDRDRIAASQLVLDAHGVGAKTVPDKRPLDHRARRTRTGLTAEIQAALQVKNERGQNLAH